MKYVRIIIIVLCFLVIYMAITTSTIKKHNDEISRLRHRITNLETVINRNVKISMPGKEKTT